MKDLTEDEALIEAIAEAIAGGPAALVDLQLRDPGTASNAYRSARAAFAAMVEHLGLTEETERGMRDDYGWFPEHWGVSDDEATHLRTRLITPWQETEL